VPRRRRAKRVIVQALESYDVPFIDVGMGVDMVDGRCSGRFA
jgi:hypothetical protein